jgi:uncharacterized protein YjbI with pentapeptide repeats
VLNVSPFVPFAFPWQMRPPSHNLVVVVKGTFDIIPGQEAALAPDQLPPSGDLRFEDQPNAGLRYPSDFAVYKPKADVMLVGHAYPATKSGVSLVTLSVGSLVRSIAVFGDRSWGALGAQSKPSPFDRMPLRWERAMGGPLSEDNPVGRGFKTGVLLPNLERKESLVGSARDVPPPACFCPVAPEWKARMRKLGSFGSKWLKTQWPFFPEDFDWSYFNAAPVEQQVPYLKGDEPFALTGVHPKLPAISGRLPAVGPRAFAQKTAAAGHEFVEIPLHIDTVWFDTDAMKLVVVWRGLVNTTDDEASELASIFVTAAQRGAPRSVQQVRAEFESAAVQTGLMVLSHTGASDAAQPPAPAPIVAAPPPPAPMSRAEVIARVAAKQPCVNLDLTGVDLSRADLKNAVFKGCIFARADLRGAQLQGASLAQAVLSFARADGASFEGSDLTECDLHAACLDGANLKGAKLGKANLTETSCKGTVLSNAGCEQAIFAGASMPGAKLDQAKCTSADFSSCKLQEADFRGAGLDKARFYGASGERARFDGAAMNNARMDKVSLRQASFAKITAEDSLWEKADLQGAVFEKAGLNHANFSRARLHNAVFNQAVAVGSSFRKAVLAGARMLKANLMQASFEGADLTDADLRGANLYQAETWRAKLKGANLQLANVAGSKLSP